jgi:sporulation protein YlmC with PRC-barrel domain
VRISTLLGLQVHTVAGERLGHVYDVRAELTSRTVKVTGLVVGKVGLLERLGLGATRRRARMRSDDVIPWSDVARADRRGIVVRDGTELR